MEATKIAYPEELPVSAHRQEILSAVRGHQVVVVCGDTGSGKTTQLPKMMLELGRGAKGRRIAVTQPRRLAAVTMAERVADELNSNVGQLVGFRHRYAKQLSSATRIEFLTDGVLLAETKFDALLRMYDTIIVDEAHERSLNVDFLLGILKRILERRRDLKVVIASATMDTAKFAAFFDAPVINVPGRLFPIDIRYRPDDEDADLPEAVAIAVRELPPVGDILVFLSGERDIREVGEHLEGCFGDSYEIIPLLASLPASEQQRAFRLSKRRRIVLATNVAETSVTIPGIRAVIDSGLARISRYVHRTQVQRLQVEPISQASARQRAGRCGRLGNGTCIRLYSEEDFLKRDEYTAPEVLRSSLAGVILTMLDLRLGSIESFPFIDPPKPAMVREGLKELLELGAIKSGYTLTETGRKLARIPLEPRLARMLAAASDNAVLPWVLPIVAAMACDDPRRRPMDEKERAAQAHAKWRVAGSDFLGTLKLWDWWRTENQSLSQSKSRKLAKANYLAWPKMREWTELTRQLDKLGHRLGMSFAEANFGKSAKGQAAFHDTIHQSLLTGLLGRIGHYHLEDREYRGAHATRFAIHPGSVLRKEKRAPEWVMAGELIDTARLFASQAAIINPDWLEPIAHDICKHHVHSPMWDADRGFVRATEQVTLYGLVIVESRRCDFARYDPEAAREIFLRRGLIDGEIAHPTPLLRETINFMRSLRNRAAKTRTPESYSEDRLLAHFVASIPQEITDANALKKWLARAKPQELERFRLKRGEWWPDESASQRDFPDTITIGDAKLHLSYCNDPDDPEHDGITCSLRKRDTAALLKWHSDWLVPGMLRKKVSFLLLCLPNSLQRLLKPLDESLAILMDLLGEPNDTLERTIRHAVYERWGFRIPKTVWQNVRMPSYLMIRFIIRDDKNGRILIDTRNQDEVRRLGKAEAKLHVPPPPENAIFASLSETLPFSYRGKLPLTMLFFLKGRNWSEAEFKNDVRKGAIKATLNDAKNDVRSIPELIRAETEIMDIARATIKTGNSIEARLGTGEYPEATVDAILNQLAWLTLKGFPSAVPLTTLRRFERYLKAIDIRLQRARVSPMSDAKKESRFAPYWQKYREALTDREHTDPSALLRYRWLLEEFRLQLFAPELKTFEPVSEKRLEAIDLKPDQD